jgi:hypothetical protein
MPLRESLPSPTNPSRPLPRRRPTRRTGGEPWQGGDPWLRGGGRGTARSPGEPARPLPIDGGDHPPSEGVDEEGHGKGGRMTLQKDWMWRSSLDSLNIAARGTVRERTWPLFRKGAERAGPARRERSFAPPAAVCPGRKAGRAPGTLARDGMAHAWAVHAAASTIRIPGPSKGAVPVRPRSPAIARRSRTWSGPEPFGPPVSDRPTLGGPDGRPMVRPRAGGP